MPVYIEINNCSECPHKDHAGCFGQIAYKPQCGKKGNKTLPYTVSEGIIGTTATIKAGIPNWCPLKK